MEIIDKNNFNNYKLPGEVLVDIFDYLGGVVA